MTPMTCVIMQVKQQHVCTDCCRSAQLLITSHAHRYRAHHLFDPHNTSWSGTDTQDMQVLLTYFGLPDFGSRFNRPHFAAKTGPSSASSRSGSRLSGQTLTHGVWCLCSIRCWPKSWSGAWHTLAAPMPASTPSNTHTVGRNSCSSTALVARPKTAAPQMPQSFEPS